MVQYAIAIAPYGSAPLLGADWRPSPPTNVILGVVPRIQRAASPARPHSVHRLSVRGSRQAACRTRLPWYTYGARERMRRMRRLAYWISIFRRSLWSLFTAFFAIGGAVTLVRDEFASPVWREALKPLNWLPVWPWYWWAIAFLVAALGAVMEGAYRTHRDQQSRLQQTQATATPGYEERDAFWALQYLLNDSVWAWKEIRSVNIWGAVATTRFGEFERVAKDGGVRARGFPGTGGEPEAIDQTHWIGAVIDPATVNSPHSVATKSLAPAIYGRKVYGGIRVSKSDVEAAWPKASWLRRKLTGLYVWLKLRWYQIEFGYQRWRTDNGNE